MTQADTGNQPQAEQQQAPQQQQAPPPQREQAPQQSAERRQAQQIRYSRADILHPSNAGGVTVGTGEGSVTAKPELLVGLMHWRSQETGQRVDSLSREEIDEWLPKFLEREV
jgi:hypothetical protein